MSVFSDLPLVIEPSDLAPRLGAPELILVDLTSAARYAEGHIPGARFVDPKRTQWGQPPAPGLLPAKADLEALFGELGHRPEATYVVYDDEGGGWAGRFIWLLDVIGHHRYHYLNGGLPAWIADAQALDREVPAPVGGPLPLTLHDEPSATREYLQSRLGAPTWRYGMRATPANTPVPRCSPRRPGMCPAQSISNGPPAWTRLAPCASARISPKSWRTSASRRTRK